MSHTIDDVKVPCGCTSDRVEEFLLAAGADRFRHAHGRSLMDHLLGTRDIMRRWLQPQLLQDAAAFHSVYSTEVYRSQLLTRTQREEVAAVIGERAERLAFLFGALPRRELFELVGGLRDSAMQEFELEGERLTRRDICALVIIHMANLAEQAEEVDGTPGKWLAKVSRLGSKLAASDASIPPIFGGCRSIVRPEDERTLRDDYLSALASIDDPEKADSLLASASAACPWVGEPYIWRAQIALDQGRPDTALLWSERAEKLLTKLGASWDKRRSLDDWLGLAQSIRTAAGVGKPAEHANGDLRRFHAYVESFPRVENLRRLRRYPGLRSLPWHDPADFPIVSLLEDAYPEIRREILSVDRNAFHSEAERIHRTGAWDVLMFHERGRRNGAVCTRCPVTAAVVDNAATVRTLAGLIYASRLKPQTEIAAHRGPTNMRLRCHLALQVPEGDCGIRVGDESRGWVEGRCIVFDDSFDHEAWNRTDAERIVLIVDLWHPDLAAAEVALLEGLHRYAAFHAEGLGRYWAANDQARAGVYH
jgi:Aspartyl/Asparaginyl beta-hydroxylase